MAQSSIFIGYRRDDTADAVGRIYDRLRAKFGAEAVFKDVDTMPIGRDFGAHVLTILPRCRVFLAVIGKNWIDAVAPNGARRLDDQEDWVRIELETALKTAGLQVVPVLVNGAVMPSREQLPPSLHGLCVLNAAVVRRDPDFHKDMDRLIEAIDSGVAGAAPPPTKLTLRSWLMLAAGVVVFLALMSALQPKTPTIYSPGGVALPAPDPAAKRIIGNASWTPDNIPAMAKRATDYARKKWQPDAVLMSLNLKQAAAGGLEGRFTFYSANQEQGISYMTAIGGLTSANPREEDVTHAIPQSFLDLPQAIEDARAQGLHGKQIEEVTLEWGSGVPCGTGNFAIDNAILPVCPPGPRYEGIQWQIDTALDDRKYVPANAR